jgi:allantoicase
MNLYRTAGAMLLAAALHGAALAAPEARAQAEIKHLLDYVATPGCQFNRNGSWHEGAEARSHLQKKYDYLVKRNLVTDAESFIKGAATGSSMSGKDYLVRCGGGKAETSAAYLKEELARFRAHAGK